MKNRIVFFLIAALLCVSCNKEWQSSIELGVNTTRINISSTLEGEFYFPVYSNGTWEIAVAEDADWLTGDSNGKGISEAHFSYTENISDNARSTSFTITAYSGKTIMVNVVQSGLIQSASSIKDSEL